MRNRRRNWMLRRIALAFAVAAVAAPVAQANPLEPGPTKAEYIPFVTDFPRGVAASDGTVVKDVVRDSNSGITASHGTVVKAGEYGMPRAMPTDYAIARGDGVELARAEGRGPGADIRSLDRIENARVEPRGIDKPILAANNSSFDWSDAGVGAGLAFAAILLLGASALSVRQYVRLGQV